ncbi:HAD family hydrolase [Thermomonas sp.]|jgi:FMN phosphatase YigB (HAD superfamily)|uniref:HAD family hydrolase n=1 Tax=Thermomonas sp. TaxID=1971895 RepID=UPI002489565E|nr:HAD family hydrolase [Thermomonas sp.]MDI1252511.1 HAD family hydrolase [Thermomonas sp.]
MSRNATADVVFLLDVDNTLLDNDSIVSDLRAHLERAFGTASAMRYWSIFEELREELGYADYLGALQRYRANAEHGVSADERLLLMSSYLIDYPFAERLYPRALEVIAHLGQFGPTVILSDGDVVFQPRKIQRSGLWDAVGGRVLIYVHKERMAEAVQRLHPAKHYVMVDDKVRLLAAVKGVLGDRLTTVLPRQGHYAMDPATASMATKADVTIQHIGDLINVDTATLLARRPNEWDTDESSLCSS